jgi:hypothetical protein
MLPAPRCALAPGGLSSGTEWDAEEEGLPRVMGGASLVLCVWEP